ncbi:helix-turn-helix domain-containing protein [Acidisoma sp. 7E03]
MDSIDGFIQRFNQAIRGKYGAGYLISQIAEDTGIAEDTIIRLQGHHFISWKMLERIAKSLDVPAHWLWSGGPFPNPQGQGQNPDGDDAPGDGSAEDIEVAR